jgi:hypothetical protein
MPILKVIKSNPVLVFSAATLRSLPGGVFDDSFA